MNNKKKKYIKPEMEIIIVNDVIISSGNTPGADEKMDID